MSLILQSNNRGRRSLGPATGFGLALGSTLILDSILTEGVTSARSLYKLTASQRGPFIRLRRVADNVLAEVWHGTANKITMASLVRIMSSGAVMTLAAFHNGGSVTMVEHFDVSGRGGLGEVVPNASQPLVISNGAFVTNDGSGPLIAYDGVDDWSEWRFLRGHPHTLIVAGSMADSASAGAAYQADGQAIGSPTSSGAALIPGNPGRQMNSGLSIGDNVSDRGRYRVQVAVFDGIASRFYSNGTLVASGDTGATRVSNFLIGKNAAGVFSNASYHTLITLNRAITTDEATAVSNAVFSLPNL